MATFLLKTEPGEYSWDDLVRDKRTAWTGVTNAAAQLAMRSMKKGDEVLLYHTGAEKRIVGLARVVKGAYPDPENPGVTAAGDPKFVLVEIAPVKPAPSQNATLAAIKADPRFAAFALVKQSRLSAMPVPVEIDTPLRALTGIQR
ncbi:MAG: EVE domain-containing protein [Phycisphaerales bacterium]|nr:EVE domain-containing protein [Phycisphaerales bacterium]